MAFLLSDLGWRILDTVAAVAIVGAVGMAIWVVLQVWPTANGDDDRG